MTNYLHSIPVSSLMQWACDLSHDAFSYLCRNFHSYSLHSQTVVRSGFDILVTHKFLCNSFYANLEIDNITVEVRFVGVFAPLHVFEHDCPVNSVFVWAFDSFKEAEFYVSVTGKEDYLK